MMSRRSKKSWVVDHRLDDAESSRRDSDSTDSVSSRQGGSGKPTADDAASQLETPEETRARRRSHYIIYAVMFVQAVGFSVVLSGVWPYLHELNGEIGKEKLGYPVAANPLGQMLASPFLGLWANKAGSIRMPMFVFLLIFIVGNVFYSFLYAFQDTASALYMMVLARFIVGVSSANVTICRSYIAGATTQAERTQGLAGIAASQAAGVFVGPLVQALLVVGLKDTRLETGVPGLVIDKYTTPSWVAAACGVFVTLLMICAFKEHPIAKKEFELLQKARGNNDQQPPLTPDKLGLVATCVSFGLAIYMTSLRETLATPLVADQYGVENGKATLYVSIALMSGGLISIFMFVSGAKLSQWFDERKIMIFGGYLPMAIGMLLHYPMGGVPIVTSEEHCDLEACTMTPGCPVDKQPWCENINQITPAQLIVTYLIVVFVYPLAMSLSQTVFSKILGPASQGVWMGLLTGCGSLARVTGPIWLSFTYTNYGTVAVYMTLAVLEAAAVILLLVTFKHLTPMAERSRKILKGHNNPALDEHSL